MTAGSTIADIDWLKHMRVHALQDPSLFDGRLPEEWVLAQCHMASDMVRSVCPEAVGRLERGTLSEDTYAGVVCAMVMRVARFQQTHQKSNGTYSYTLDAPQSNPPGYDGMSTRAIAPTVGVSPRQVVTDRRAVVNKLHTSPASSSDYSLRVTVDSSNLLAYIRNCSTLKSQDLCSTEAPWVSAWGLFHMRVRAEAVGFEPTLALQHAKAAYQTAAIDLSAMPPKRTPHRQVKNA